MSGAMKLDRPPVCGKMHIVRAKVLFFLLVLILSAPRALAGPGVEITCPEKVHQGQGFFVRIASTEPVGNLKLQWLGKALRPAVFKTGSGYEAVAMLGAGLDVGAGVAVLSVEAKVDGEKKALRRQVAISAKEYPEQRITVPKDMVELTDKALSRHYAEKETVQKVLSRVFRAQYLKQPFQRPVPGKVSGIFGTRRFYNDQPRSPHKGVDFKAHAGQRVHCFSGGRVVLIGEHYFAGKSVYVDHGQGVVSMYCHLSKVLVKKGREVEKGEVVGLAGMTGRATGPHLHFGLSVLGQAVDPLPFLQ